MIANNHGELQANGRMDREAMIKDVAENKCEVKSHSQEDFAPAKISDTVALLTYKPNLDAVCEGKAAPKQSWVGSIFVKSGEKWSSAFYMGTPAP